jgi:hypothetical protein
MKTYKDILIDYLTKRLCSYQEDVDKLALENPEYKIASVVVHELRIVLGLVENIQGVKMSEPQDVCKKCGGLGETTRYDDHSQETVTESCHHYRSTGGYVAFQGISQEKVLQLIQSRFGHLSKLSGEVTEEKKEKANEPSTN